MSTLVFLLMGTACRTAPKRGASAPLLGALPPIPPSFLLLSQKGLYPQHRYYQAGSVTVVEDVVVGTGFASAHHEFSILCFLNFDLTVYSKLLRSHFGSKVLQ